MMGELIDDLLTFSHLVRTQTSLSALDMEALVREVWKETTVENPNHNLTIKIDKLPAGTGDRTLMKQVLVHLLSNAVKFSRVREEVLIEAAGYVHDGECVYSIRDNGIGFDMAYYDKLFGVFQRLNRQEEYEGTGVGLAIVQRIITRHGGRVWAKGDVDKGATFYFTLPQKHD